MLWLAWKSLRHRTSAFTASFLVMFFGATMLMSFASMLDTSLGDGMTPASEETLSTMGSVVGELKASLGEAEGAFLLCGFTMALATHRVGDRVGAFRWFERTRAACGPPGLFAEEYDVRQRQLRGNLPQAFVHAMMLECSVRLAGESALP